MPMTTRKCDKCGKSHDLILEDMITKQRIHEFNVCYDCIFEGTKLMLIEERVDIETDMVDPLWLLEKMKGIEEELLSEEHI